MPSSELPLRFHCSNLCACAQKHGEHPYQQQQQINASSQVVPPSASRRSLESSLKVACGPACRCKWQKLRLGHEPPFQCALNYCVAWRQLRVRCWSSQLFERLMMAKSTLFRAIRTLENCLDKLGCNHEAAKIDPTAWRVSSMLLADAAILAEPKWNQGSALINSSFNASCLEISFIRGTVIRGTSQDLISSTCVGKIG